MESSFVTRAQNQLGLVRDLLVISSEVGTPPLIRERLAVALERISLVQELMSTVNEELFELQRQNETSRRALKSSDDLRLQKRESQQDNQKAVPKAPNTERYIAPDEGLIDSYSVMAVQYGELRRETELMRANIEVAIRLLGEFWGGDDETKTFVIEKFREALPFKAK